MTLKNIMLAIAKVAEDTAANLERASNEPNLPLEQVNVLRSIAKFLRDAAVEARKGKRNKIKRICKYLGLEKLWKEYCDELAKERALDKWAARFGYDKRDRVRKNKKDRGNDTEPVEP